MTTSNTRPANEITTEELVAAYNNTALTNQGVCDELNTTWAVIRGKVRSKATQELLTLERTGGASGTFEQSQETNDLQNITVHDQATGQTSTSLKSTAPLVDSNNDLPEPTTDTDNDAVYSSEQPSEFAFQFTAIITGQNFTFGADTRKDALRKFLVEAQELKMKNITIVDEDTHEEVDIKRIAHNGVYIITDQQSAA